jgi:hypothetical protein
MAHQIDKDIHLGYKAFPGNYIAIDRLSGTSLYADKYTEEQVATFDQYIEGQLAKVTIPHPDVDFLREKMLLMYANPIRNRNQATQV